MWKKVKKTKSKVCLYSPPRGFPNHAACTWTHSMRNTANNVHTIVVWAIDIHLHCQQHCGEINHTACSRVHSTNSVYTNMYSTRAVYLKQAWYHTMFYMSSLQCMEVANGYAIKLRLQNTFCLGCRLTLVKKSRKDKSKVCLHSPPHCGQPTHAACTFEPTACSSVHTIMYSTWAFPMSKSPCSIHHCRIKSVHGDS